MARIIPDLQPAMAEMNRTCASLSRDTSLLLTNLLFILVCECIPALQAFFATSSRGETRNMSPHILVKFFFDCPNPGNIYVQIAH